MEDQDSVQARKEASAAGATNNSGLGIDGDDPSVADTEADHTVDPVTGTSGNATGAEQAAENEDREPVG